MIYVAIDNESEDGKALVAYIETLPITHIYKEPNAGTRKAMKEIQDGKGKVVDDVNEWFNKMVH